MESTMRANNKGIQYVLPVAVLLVIFFLVPLVNEHDGVGNSW
jgi:ABC-type sugar transport system permease subunit